MKKCKAKYKIIYDHYLVRDNGEVWNLDTLHKLVPVEVKPMNGCNYKMYYVSINNNSKSIARLVADAFIPDTDLNPDGTKINGKKVVDHINGNTADNRVINLRWCDNKFNLTKGHRSSTANVSKRVLDLDTKVEYESAKEASRVLNCDIGNLTKVCRGEYHYMTIDGEQRHFMYI